MIKSINTENFETHINTSIDLHPGVNTFVGESDEGKSGIVRQIKWNSKNRPKGDSYRNDALDPKKKSDKLKLTQVKIDYEGSGIVTRARDGFKSGVNHYQIGVKEPLRALRMDVPDEVQELTRMKDVNIQGQHPTEQYFMLADKPGQVAKQFNKVAGLTIMDDAIKSINSQVRTCNTEIAITKKEIEAKTKELKDTEWVLKAEKLADKLSKYEKKLNKKKAELKAIGDAVHLIEEIDKKLKRFDDIGDAKIRLKELETEKLNISTKENDIEDIDNTILAMKSVDTALKNTVNVTDAKKMLKSLETLRSNIDEDQEKIDNISDLLAKIKENTKKETKATMKLIDAQQAHLKMWREEECPVCGRSGK